MAKNKLRYEPPGGSESRKWFIAWFSVGLEKRCLLLIKQQQPQLFKLHLNGHWDNLVLSIQCVSFEIERLKTSI